MLLNLYFNGGEAGERGAIDAACAGNLASAATWSDSFLGYRFDTQLILSAAWGLPFQAGPVPLKFQGFINYNTDKGKDYAGVKTEAETLMRTIADGGSGVDGCRAQEHPADGRGLRDVVQQVRQSRHRGRRDQAGHQHLRAHAPGGMALLI